MITEDIVTNESEKDVSEPDAVIADEPSGVSEELPAEGAAEAPEADEIDYAELVASDLGELKRQFPELGGLEDITELDNPLRYAALRDLGLTPREAYLATGDRRSRLDNRAHLSTAVPRGAGAPRGGMSRDELYRARELFEGMSDTELQALYRKVNA